MNTTQSSCVDEAGFTLVEAIIGVFLLAVLFTMLGQVLATNMRVNTNSRAQQQASTLGIDALEGARDLSWAELAMANTEPGDPRIASGQLLAVAVGLEGNEAVVVNAADGLMAPVTTEILEGEEFTVRRYVTEVDTGLRRALVVVQWKMGDTVHEHQVSVLLSDVRAA